MAKKDIDEVNPMGYVVKPSAINATERYVTLPEVTVKGKKQRSKVPYKSAFNKGDWMDFANSVINSPIALVDKGLSAIGIDGDPIQTSFGRLGQTFSPTRWIGAAKSGFKNSIYSDKNEGLTGDPHLDMLIDLVSAYGASKVKIPTRTKTSKNTITETPARVTSRPTETHTVTSTQNVTPSYRTPISQTVSTPTTVRPIDRTLFSQSTLDAIADTNARHSDVLTQTSTPSLLQESVTNVPTSKIAPELQRIIDKAKAHPSIKDPNNYKIQKLTELLEEYTPTFSELPQNVKSNIIDTIEKQLHVDSNYLILPNSSQFDILKMLGKEITPEHIIKDTFVYDPNNTGFLGNTAVERLKQDYRFDRNDALTNYIIPYSARRTELLNGTIPSSFIKHINDVIEGKKSMFDLTDKELYYIKEGIYDIDTLFPNIKPTKHYMSILDDNGYTPTKYDWHDDYFQEGSMTPREAFERGLNVYYAKVPNHDHTRFYNADHSPNIEADGSIIGLAHNNGISTDSSRLLYSGLLKTARNMKKAGLDPTKDIIPVMNPNGSQFMTSLNSLGKRANISKNIKSLTEHNRELSNILGIPARDPVFINGIYYIPSYIRKRNFYDGKLYKYGGRINS